jgi:basic membrane protein A and related proteins
MLKIGMFVVGDGYNDSGYKHNCKKGLLSALKENRFDTLFVSSVTHMQEEIDYFPENGCDALFLAGSLATEQLIVAAEKYPQTQFVIVDYKYEGLLQNVQSIYYNIDEAAFPLGFLAAYWASYKDNNNPVVGIIGGMDIDPIQRFTKAYDLGISYFNSKYNREVKTVVTFLNSFDNSDFGYYIADSLITNCNVDVILPVAGAAGNGALYAAKANNKWAVGVDADQYYSLPDIAGILISSCLKQLDTTICSVATAFVSNPVINNSTYTGTLENKGVALAPFHDYESQIPDSIKLTIQTIKTGIITGTIDTGF